MQCYAMPTAAVVYTTRVLQTLYTQRPHRTRLCGGNGTDLDEQMLHVEFAPMHALQNGGDVLEHTMKRTSSLCLLLSAACLTAVPAARRAAQASR
jgi:hypothetical protein